MASLKSIVVISALLSTAFSLPHQGTFKWKSHTPALPLSEVEAGLPTPASEGLTLKYIALGLGTQNYSCADGASTPTAVGALARLFDATQYLSARKSAVDSLPTQYLKPFEEIYDTAECTACNVNGELKFPCQDAVNQRLDHLPILGEHFFTSAAVPTFDLAAVGLLLASKKVGDVPAPADAYAGADGEGAVDWLYLTDNGSGVSVGLKAVYRVETAGGDPPATCAGQPENIYVPYAAEYWLYD